MSKRESVKMTKEEVEVIISPISREEFMKEYNGNTRETISIVSNRRISEIVTKVAIRTGYHPAGYGIWDTIVSKKGDVFYAEWNRSETCD